MKVFISADIEGVATTTLWDETSIQRNPALAGAHAEQMTQEVKAACEGAIEAGADHIVVRDAHGYGTNIDPRKLPRCAEIIRNWSGHPYGMACGVDSSFDAAMFIGYHSAAGREGNPLSHTMTRDTVWIKLNGQKCSEFRLYSYVCALEGVPSVLVTGDKMLCDDSQGIHPMLVTVPVKDGHGGMTRSIHPELACERIRAAAQRALGQSLLEAKTKLPEHFVLELCYKEHTMATRMSFFPNFHKVDDNTIHMETDNYMDVLIATRFIV